jgi:hypothetical protein
MKKAAKPAPKSAPKPRRVTRRHQVVHALKRPRFLGALVGGIVLLAFGAFLWKQLAGLTFNDTLLKKMPADSTVAGVARLSEADTKVMGAFANKGQVLPTGLKPVLDAVNSADPDGKALQEAVKSEFAWSDSSRGAVAVFTVKNPLKLQALSDKLSGSVESFEQSQAGDISVRTGQLKGTTQKISVAVSGGNLYLASNPELIGAAKGETNGFTSLPGYTEVSDQLPPAQGGYVFYNTGQIQSAVAKRYRVVGVSWAREGNDLTLSSRVSDQAPVQLRLPESDGALLAPAELASASIGGTDPAKYVRVLEAQRQEDDLPKVLAFQKSVAALDRAIGGGIVNDYLAKATGDWSYSRYMSDAGEQWMAAVEFPDAATAQGTVDQLAAKLNQNVTIPVRRDVITVLPDGTSSREVESEGRVPVAFVDSAYPGGTAKSATFPSIGPINFVVKDRYLLVASELGGLQRLDSIIAATPAKVNKGDLTVRAHVQQANAVITKTDPLLDWILATTPSEGNFVLTSDGVISGSLDFARRQ